MILAMVCDNCNTNLAACNLFVPLLPVGMRLPCWSHVTNNSGDKFLTPLVDEFFLLYTALFSHSSKMKTAWKLRFGRIAIAHSAVRWYSKYEVLKQAFDEGWVESLFDFLLSDAVSDLRENASVTKMIEWCEFFEHSF